MALRCGADAVIQLPYAFSVREAEYFALGGVAILDALGVVTHLSFGSETDDLPLLRDAATHEMPVKGTSEELVQIRERRSKMTDGYGLLNKRHNH